MRASHQTGRKTNWFRDECDRIVTQEKLIEFVGRVAKGEEKEERISEGAIIEIKASIHDRLDAFEMLCNWAYGKPTTMIDGNSSNSSADIAKQRVRELLGELGIAVIGSDNERTIHRG